jgi:L-aspartate oxidase
MWKSVGLFRTRERLQAAIDALDGAYAAERESLDVLPQPDADAWRRLNLVTVARLIAHAALRREESRGGHFRADFPERDDRHWRMHLVDVRHD